MSISGRETASQYAVREFLQFGGDIVALALLIYGRDRRSRRAEHDSLAPKALGPKSGPGFNGGE